MLMSWICFYFLQVVPAHGDVHHPPRHRRRAQLRCVRPRPAPSTRADPSGFLGVVLWVSPPRFQFHLWLQQRVFSPFIPAWISLCCAASSPDPPWCLKPLRAWVPPSLIFLPELPQAAKAAPDLSPSLQGPMWVPKPPSMAQGLGFCPRELGTCLAPWHKSLAAARAAAALSGAAQRGLLSAPAGVGSHRFPRRWSTEENRFLLRRGKLSAPLSRAVITGGLPS